MIISQGAEAIIIREGNNIVKNRISKSYRLEELDKKLRQFRTRREAKVLEKLQEINFSSPKLINCDDKNMKLTMNFIEGQKIRDVINKDNFQELCNEIGKKIAQLHDKNIIHSDLTTSNMIFSDELNLIDFGLSFFSDKPEDKAVDLHLLARAFESKHYELYPEAIQIILESYKKNCSNSSEILKRLEVVQKRGRNKK